MPASAREIRHQLGTYQNASAITGVLQLAIDTLDLEVATLLRHGEDVISLHARSPTGHPRRAQAASARRPTQPPRHCRVPASSSKRAACALAARAACASSEPRDRRSRTTTARPQQCSHRLWSTPRPGWRCLQREGGWARAGSDDLESARLRRKLRDRDALIDQLSGIQRALSQRAPLQDILNTIVDAAVGAHRRRDGQPPPPRSRRPDPPAASRRARVLRGGRAVHGADPHRRGRSRPCVHRGPARRHRGLSERQGPARDPRERRARGGDVGAGRGERRRDRRTDRRHPPARPHVQPHRAADADHVCGACKRRADQRAHRRHDGAPRVSRHA